MFDHTHYVPILRWKRAERWALKDLPHSICDAMTPLFEPTSWAFADTQKRKTLESKISNIAEDILQLWGQDPFFMDFWHVPANARSYRGRDSLLLMANEARRQQLHLIPVTGLGRDPATRSAVKEVISTDGNGVCLRLFRKDLGDAALQAQIADLLSELRIQPSQVDMIVDLQCVEQSTRDYSSLTCQVPFLDQWRTFTIAGGALPKDLSDFDPGKGLHPRWEWRKWCECVQAREIPRLPSFADYTIQHPLFEEPPKGAAPSASIRYTTDENWVIIRGLSVRRDDAAGYQQWPANAEILCMQPEFLGAAFSQGDRYIEETSKQTARPGNAESWLRAGFNHHMTFVVRQLATLFGIAIAL